jgi:hypothetical protein
MIGCIELFITGLICLSIQEIKSEKQGYKLNVSVFLVVSHGPRDAFTAHVKGAAGAVDPTTNLHLQLSLNCEGKCNNFLIVMNLGCNAV